MAKDTSIAAVRTPDLFGAPSRRGRPPSPHAMTAAQRQAKYRKTHFAYDLGPKIGATIKRLSKEFDLNEDQIVRHLLAFALCNRNWSQSGFPTVKKETDFRP